MGGRCVCYLIWKPLAGTYILKRREFFLFVEFIKKTGSGLDLMECVLMYPFQQDARVGNSVDQFAPATAARLDEVLQFQLSLRHARWLYETGKTREHQLFIVVTFSVSLNCNNYWLILVWQLCLCFRPESPAPIRRSPAWTRQTPSAPYRPPTRTWHR